MFNLCVYVCVCVCVCVCACACVRVCMRVCVVKGRIALPNVYFMLVLKLKKIDIL